MSLKKSTISEHAGSLPRPTLDEFFLSLLGLLAARGTCPRRRVAAIVTDAAGRVLSMGYNGVPRGVAHCTNPGTACAGVDDEPGDTSRCLAVHAEANALLQLRDKDNARVLYCSCVPCFECAKLVLNTSITRVVCAEDYPGGRGRPLLEEAMERYDTAAGSVAFKHRAELVVMSDLHRLRGVENDPSGSRFYCTCGWSILHPWSPYVRQRFKKHVREATI